MAPAVRSTRATPRWPVTGERFVEGWPWLSAARPLLDLVVDSAAADPGAIDDGVIETLRHVREAADATLVALLVVEAPRDAPAMVVLRGVVGDGVIDAPALSVPLGTPVVAPVVGALAHLVTPTFAVEMPLALPGDDAHPAGILVVLAAGANGLDERIARALRVLEETAWVLALALRRGWQAWRTPEAWPGLDAGELSACRAALERERRLPTRDVPRPVDENVQFTVYRPRRIPLETWCTILAFAHLAERRPEAPDAPDPLEEMRRQAAQVLGDLASTYADTTQDSAEAIPRAGEITFALDLPDLEVNPRQRSFRWLEDVQREEFHVRASRALDGRTVRGTLHVYLGAIVVAEVALAIRVDSATSSSVAPDVESAHARPYRRIFPSYSHLDEPIVQQVEAYARTLGDEYLRDVTHLRSGEVWSERLADFIRTADVFQLFWSRNSMSSTWVRREWEYALSLGRPLFIRPTYWETPMPESPELPPPALRALHFQRLPVTVPAELPRPAPAPAAVAPPAPLPPPSAPSPAPAPPAPHRRRTWTPHLAIAAVLLVGLVGMWNVGRVGAPVSGGSSEVTPAKPGPEASLAAVSPDGRLAAVMDASARIVISRRQPPGDVERVIPTTLARADVVALRFSADGTRIVCETRDGGTIEWDRRTGERIRAPA